MARITIEDCLEKISNHFQLVLVASRRARQLQEGSTPRIEDSGEKSSIIALREIAAGLVGKEVFTEPLIKDATADSELAELINHGLMNQRNMARALGEIEEDEVAPGGAEPSAGMLPPKATDSVEGHPQGENGSGVGVNPGQKESTLQGAAFTSEEIDLPVTGTNGGNAKKTDTDTTG